VSQNFQVGFLWTCQAVGGKMWVALRAALVRTAALPTLCHVSVHWRHGCGHKGGSARETFTLVWGTVAAGLYPYIHTYASPPFHAGKQGDVQRGRVLPSPIFSMFEGFVRWKSVGIGDGFAQQNQGSAKASIHP